MCESDRLLLKEIARNLSGKAKILQKSDVWMSESCTDLVRIITNYLGGPQPVMEADAEKCGTCSYDKQLIRWVKNHYWDSLEKDKDLILRHLRTFAGDVDASQPVIQADAEKPCGPDYDCHYRKAIIHDSRCPKFRTA